MKIFDKIWRKWIKLRLQPIRVFCLHHVCSTLDAEWMNAFDWMQIDEFKSKVIAMQQDGVEFISLTNAYKHISDDWVRCKKYAVLTFDDGYASLREILPWLEEQQISATLFINGKYLDGKSYRKNPQEQYLTRDELSALTSPMIEIGSHGWVHTDATQMTDSDFSEYINKNVRLLSTQQCYVPFHAYTWGKHTSTCDEILANREIIPVLVDGMKNYNDKQYVHRELMD